MVCAERRGPRKDGLPRGLPTLPAHLGGAKVGQPKCTQRRARRATADCPYGFQESTRRMVFLLGLSMMPRSVMMAVMYLAGVTSKAGL